MSWYSCWRDSPGALLFSRYCLKTFSLKEADDVGHCCTRADVPEVLSHSSLKTSADMLKHVLLIPSQVTGHALELRQEGVSKLPVPSYCCSVMRGLIAFGPTGLAVALDISSGGEVAWFSRGLSTDMTPLHSTPLTGRAVTPQRQGHIGGPIAQP